eukprot:2148828-Pleurochrysis_carterae.AAC.2
MAFGWSTAFARLDAPLQQFLLVACLASPEYRFPRSGLSHAPFLMHLLLLTHSFPFVVLGESFGEWPQPECSD